MLETIQRVIVVEDEPDLCEAIARIVADWGALVSVAGTAAEARELLAKAPPPDLILVDIRLPDGSAVSVIDIAHGLSPTPVVVAMSGKASPDEAFELAFKGVRGYLAKPFSRRELCEAVEDALRESPSLGPLIKAKVGQIPLRSLQREVRRVMLREALDRSAGSRSGAARLLRVTRQAVQQMLRSEDPECDTADEASQCLEPGLGHRDPASESESKHRGGA